MKKGISYTLDAKVPVTMFLLAALFLGLMAFKYNTKQPCGAVDFSYRTASKFDEVYTNEAVYFSSELKYNADSWKWDFGDKSAMDAKSGPYTTHEYRQPGQYTVRLMINEKCEFARTINVNRRDDIGKKLYLMPLWPAGDPLVAGTEYNFGDNTTGANTWSWYFDGEPKRLQKNVSYIFTETGIHKVVLVINEDLANNRTEKIFNVKAPPPGVSIPPRSTPNPQNAGGGVGTGLVNNDAPNHDKLPGQSIDQMANADKSKKIPTLTDDVLRSQILKINGSGYTEIAKYLKKNNFENCTILFNDHPVTVEQLKENIAVQLQYGKSFDVKQSTTPENNIILLTIKAELTPKNRLVFKDKPRKYPY